MDIRNANSGLSSKPPASTKSAPRSGSYKSLDNLSHTSKSSKNSVDEYKPLNILVFKNGDEYDAGLEMSVTRKHFKNWLTFLDYLTERLKMTEGAVHKVYAYPSGTEVRHFTELEAGGRFFVAAHARLKKVKYGKHERLTNFNTVSQPGRSPRDEIPGLSSKDSLEYYLKSHGFKPKLGDIWQDKDFNLRKQRQAAKSQENLNKSNNREMSNLDSKMYETTSTRNEFSLLEASEFRPQSPQRSRSDFSKGWMQEKSENFQSTFSAKNENREGDQHKSNFVQRSQSLASIEADGFDKSYSRPDLYGTSADPYAENRTEFSANQAYEADARRESTTNIRPRSTTFGEQEPRPSTTTLRTKRNIKLQTEELENASAAKVKKSVDFEDEQAKPAVGDAARFEMLKKEKSYVSDYWKTKERLRREKLEREKTVELKSETITDLRKTSLERLNRRMTPPTNYDDRAQTRQPRIRQKLPKIGPTGEKSPRWAEDLTQAVLELSQKVERLSARSERQGLFDSD